MKRIISCLIIFMVGITAGQAQNPIPSYNFPVNQRANTQEIQGPTRAKKKVNVTAQCVSGKSLSCTATVWIYSLDLQPFTAHSRYRAVKRLPWKWMVKNGVFL